MCGDSGNRRWASLWYVFVQLLEGNPPDLNAISTPVGGHGISLFKLLFIDCFVG